MTVVLGQDASLRSQPAIYTCLLRWICVLAATHLFCLEAACRPREVRVGKITLPVPAKMAPAQLESGIEPEWAKPEVAFVDADTGTRLVVATVVRDVTDVSDAISGLEEWLSQQDYGETRREYYGLSFKMARVVHEKRVETTRLIRDDICVSDGTNIYFITWLADGKNYRAVRGLIARQIRALAFAAPLDFHRRIIWWLYGRDAPLLALVLMALTAWIVAWKGVALWKSARRRNPAWFITLFLLGPLTLGIVEIVYIYALRQNVSAVRDV